MNSKLNEIIKRITLLESRVAKLESSNDIENKVRSIYDNYKDYDYIDEDLDGYHIKTIDEFNEARGGICWDFVGPIANDLDTLGIPYKCYFTGLHKDGEMIASHTYVITETSPKCWIECAWMDHSGVHECTSYKYVEDTLMNDYEADEAHTLTYDPFEVYGDTVQQFFDYLEQNAIEL